MHVVTFYSFKGGVGRTHAAVNVAVSLADAGLQTLLVDFDLEAPGLSYLPALAPKSGDRKGGVAEFIADSWETKQTQDFAHYIYQPEDLGECLSVMPAGNVGASSFSKAFSQVRDFWAVAFDKKQGAPGITFFRDLRSAWETVAYDYVIIDSRTGLTDIGGVCTRLLPDQLILIFGLSEQGLEGTKQVLDQVGKETLYGNPIDIKMVASMVPADVKLALSDKRITHAEHMLGRRPRFLFPVFAPLFLEEDIRHIESSISTLAEAYRSLRDEIRRSSRWDVQFRLAQTPLSVEPLRELVNDLLSTEADRLHLRPRWKTVNDAAVALVHSLAQSSEAKSQAQNLAISALRESRARLDPIQYSDLYGLTQNNLANALMSQSAPNKEARAGYLKEAAGCYREALRAYSADRYEKERADTLNHLGRALTELSVVDGEGRLAHLKEAVSSYQEALGVYTGDRYAEARAETLSHLGRVLVELSAVDVEGQIGHLKEAASSYLEALQVYTAESYPREWAGTRVHLARVVRELALRNPAERTNYLKEAEELYRKALDVYTENRYPLERLQVLNDLADTRREQAERETMEQPAYVSRVFISSTEKDLKEYRQRARDAAIGASFLPVMMEYFTAEGARPPLSECLNKVAGTDLLVVIVAHRYGWVPENQPRDKPKNITWLECEKAKADNKEVLAFLLDESHPWPEEHKEEYQLLEAARQGKLTPELVETVQRNLAGLRDFRTWLQSELICVRFTSAEDLRGRVSEALRDWRERHRQVLPVPAPTGDPTGYLVSLLERTSYIDIRGLQVGTGKAYRFPIEELYITLTTTATEETPHGRPEGKRRRKGRQGLPSGAEAFGRSRIPLQRALQQANLVVVGDPGSGKTTFLRRIAFALCQALLGQNPEAALKHLGMSERPLPILIRLAQLAEHIDRCRGGQHSAGLGAADSAAWISHYLGTLGSESNWGLNEAFFRDRLQSGDAILLLDGLDEGATRSARKSLSALLENARLAYPKCRMVVTSRPGAYTGEVILSDFAHAYIDPLEEEAVESFLTRWCDTLYPESVSEAVRHRNELVGALQSSPEIRRMARNPVMLTALAVVHWNEKRLPEQRVDLYDSIITWLARSREQRPGRMPSDRCVRLLHEVALAMQDHPKGRQVQVPTRWAAEQTIAPRLREVAEEERILHAEKFLEEEEIDSGIVVGRGDQIQFWHLTFQEFMAAMAIAGRSDQKQRQLVLSPKKLYLPEWREVVLLLAGALHRQGVEKLDGLVTAILDLLGKKPALAEQARCVGLLGAMLRDLEPLRYQAADPRYATALREVQRIFDPKQSQSVPVEERIQAAEALGQAGDRRLEENNWITIAAGTFWRGAQKKDSSERNYDPDADDDESPVLGVYLDAYEIARFPLTVQEYKRFVDDGGYKNDKWWKAGGFGEFQEPEDWERQLAYRNRPVVGVSWCEASAYCRWAEIRLPTEAEWERAARGTKARKYPWGDEPCEPNRLNYDKGKIGHATPVGVYPLGATPEGIQDMAGNVWEWVRDWYGKYEEKKTANPQGPGTGADRVLRGGCWISFAWYCRSAIRYRYAPAYRHGFIGFRPARSLPSAL